MNILVLFRRLALAAIAGLSLTVSSTSQAAELYWVNDFGGTWDESFAGATNWKDSADQTGIPNQDGDSAFLVLPYSLSFCPPGETWEDGNCITQPVPVIYRSDTNPRLSQVIIESDNVLWQRDGFPAEQLNLTSDVEIVGGSGTTFDPPPSFFLADPPGIFPSGRHVQEAGTNVVNSQLEIGGIDGSSGTYELRAGSLSVGDIEIIGDEGTGLFQQSGGVHKVFGDLQLGLGENGSGRYELSGASEFEVAGTATIGAAGAGELLVSTGANAVIGEDLVLGQEPGSRGSVQLEGDSRLTVKGDTHVGADGIGEFIARDVSTHSVDGNLNVDGPDSFYEMHGTATLDVAENLNISQAAFRQLGGGVVGVDGNLEVSKSGIEPAYLMGGGTLGVAGNSSLKFGLFDHRNGSHTVEGDAFFEGDPVGGSATYLLDSGALDVQGAEYLGTHGRGDFEQIGESSIHRAGNLVLGYVLPFDDEGRPIPDFGAPVGNATYDIFGGELSVGSLHLQDGLDTGFNAVFNQFAGSVTADRGVVIGSGGLDETAPGSSYVLEGGSLVAAAGPAGDPIERFYGRNGLIVGARGNLIMPSGAFRGERAMFTQFAGTDVQVRGDLRIGLFENTPGIYRQLGGDLSVQHDIVVERNSELELYPRGTLDYGTDSLINRGAVTVIEAGMRTFNGTVDNDGIFQVTRTTAIYERNFNNNGTYISNSSDNFFQDLVVEADGYLVADAASRFLVDGNLENYSALGDSWQTETASLFFEGSTDHDFYVTGVDFGASVDGVDDNFSWGALSLASGEELYLLDGNAIQGAALYVGTLDLLDGLVQLDSIFSDFNIYYDATLAGNAWLGAETYALAGTGFLMPFTDGNGQPPSVPEPPTLSLFGIGLLGLGFVGWRRKRGDRAQIT